MTSANDAHLVAAKRLLAHEGGLVDGEPAAAAERVYEKMYRSLAPVIGAVGTRAIAARSVKQTTARLSSLRDVVTTQDVAEDYAGAVRQLVNGLRALEPAAAEEAATAFVAGFLRLLTTFIGPGLVVQLVKSAYPGMDEIGLEETS